MRLLWGLLWACSFFGLSLQKPRLLLFSPNVVRLGVPLTVGVLLQDAPPGQVVKGSVFLRNPNSMRACSTEQDFTLSSQKSYTLLSLQVPLTWVESCGLSGLSDLRQHVQLMARSPWLKDSLSKVTDTQGINLLFSSRRGHIFLQTDQPIYNPGQGVRYRIFALDQDMRPSVDAMTVTVENSRGFLVQKKVVRISSKLLFQDDFVIPDISEPGTWRISARFSDSLNSSSSTQFEVKKYVLPNFEVKIIPGKPYILTTADYLDEIQLDIQARYMYGQPVQGVAYVRFGLLDEDGEKTFLRGLETQNKLVDGQSHIALSKAQVQGALVKLNMALPDLLGLRLYVAAAIIESPGGDMEEAELTSWRFVSSPYSLDLSNTKRHLVPGDLFLFQALVREVSGSLAPGVPVKVSATFTFSGSGSEKKDFEQNSDDSGRVSIPIVIPETIAELQLWVSAGSHQPAEARLTVKAPPSGGPGFLSIERLDMRPPRVGDTFKLNLRAVGVREDAFSHYYYMVLSRGQILSVNQESRRKLTSVSVFVNHRMAPSFYLVAFYYYRGLPVANSLRVDVQGKDCEGKLEINVDTTKKYRNGDPLKLHLKTDSPAFVALGAMDTALYAAGGRAHKPLSMAKVFEVMNGYDLGCGPGGGDTALQVFQAAGLAFSDGDQLTSTKKSMSCPTEKTRKKRNVNFQKAISEKLGQYASPEARRCCQDGLTQLPMRRSCEQRAARVPQPACREPFLSCCQFAENLRKKTRTKNQVGFARALEMVQEEELIEEDLIQVRSFFPENWLWKLETVDTSKVLSMFVPDSLTTWEIHGVSVSQSTGLCVATPVRLQVFREFHLHLRLPPSVRRFEQLELRPVLYNYLNEDLTVSVHVSPVEGLCMAGGRGLSQQVLVPAGSARPVTFSVVPMAAGAVSLKVVAQGPFVGDAVSKVLQIEKEGVIHTEELVYELNPLDHRARTWEIPGKSDPNMIPDGDFSSLVRVTASDPLDALGSEGALSPGGVVSLLRLPRGCGEQTMVYLAPTLAASRYLDKTEQWSSLPPETKDHAVDLIQKGYMRIQQFRKTDGSYGAWLHRDSSTWLTAFVLKVLSLAQEQVGGSPEKLQETARWLLTQQQDDGSFQDPCPVIHRGMQGGLVGNDETVALTAFVVIALHHGLATFQNNEEELKQQVTTSISRANSFLGGKASAGLLGVHAAATTAYALTLTKAPQDIQSVAHNNLMAMAQETDDYLYWGSVAGSEDNVVSPSPAPHSPTDPVLQAPALWIETTAYGLLHLLLREGKAEMAERAAAWLNHQGSFQGGFRSTQDTVMALDALSAYWITSYTPEEKGLNVTLSSMGRTGLKFHTLQLNNHQVKGLEEQLQFSLGNSISVQVNGNSKGTLKILRAYNVLDLKNTTCQDLQIEVTVTGHVEYTMEANEDYEDYEEYGELPAGDDPDAHWQPVTPLQLFEGRRNRRRREAPKVVEEQESKVQYTVCIWRNGKVGLSGMAIADITLLSGFHALQADLEKLTSLSDRYVSHFETEGPHVLLYFDSVPTARECVGFGAIQEVAVGLVQPASAVLYDYYNPERKCSVFYGAPSKSKLLATLCSGTVCQCAEGKCPRQRRALERGLQDEDGYRMKFACYSPRVEYGFQVKVLREDSRAAFRLFETRLIRILHFTSDTKATAGQTRNFLVRASCRLHLEPGKEYLIMGLDGVTEDLKGDPQYLLDSNTWIEEMPSERLCRSTRQREACNQLNSFLQEYGTQGCQV
ncbi:complement C4-A-like isoform X1 [Ochotona curzoniae]|uniref:complement C4-A-like isoform X1 n=1 Tax=Ochotona curzoniae TaxID=130825 RepID=UPI001B34F44B|nr:complement C4-A-like isoform X1 [Ochotona curzoniae]